MPYIPVMLIGTKGKSKAMRLLHSNMSTLRITSMARNANISLMKKNMAVETQVLLILKKREVVHMPILPDYHHLPVPNVT
jgi:hypothetical protein